MKKRLFLLPGCCALLVVTALADYDAVPSPFFSDVTEASGAEVLVPDASGCASTGKFKVGRVMDAKVFGQMNEADAKFVRCAAEVTLAITGETMRVRFDCPVPEGMTYEAPNSPWWGDRVAFTVRRTADDPAVIWFVAGASGARECGRFPIGGGKDETWKSASRIAVTTNASAYCVTMDIPLVDAFGKIPSPGDVYGVNFQRLGRTAGGPSAWAVNGGSYNTEKQVFGALVVGGSGPYFARRLAAAESRGRELATDADSGAAVARLLRPVRRAVAEHGADAKAFGSLERMFGQLERAFVAVAQKGEALLLFEPEDAWGNAIEPTEASRPLEGVKIRSARNTRVVRAFALANLGGAPFVGCLKAFDRDWWYFQYQNSDGWGKKDGLLKHTRIRRGVPIYSRERRVLYDPLVDLPVGSLVEVAPGATVPLYLELDTHGLKPGTHKGWLKLQSCAPGFPDRKIPYEVTVTDDDLDAFDTWRAGYTHFGMTCRPNYEPVTNAVRELVRRGYNTVLLSRLDIYPTRDAKGVWHAAPCALADRYIDLWLAAGLDPKKLRLLVYFGVERDNSDMWWGLRDEKQVRLPFGSPDYDEGLRFMVRSLTDHFRTRYGVGLDRILWYPVDEAEGKFPDPALKSSAARCVHAARVIKSVDPANRIYSDPMWGFFVSKDFLAAKEDFVRDLDVIEPSRPQLTAKTVANLKEAGAKELWSYHVSEREYPSVNYRLHAWENMRDGMRPITTYWHLDECSGFSFKAKHAYASTYVDLDYDLLSISRRQLAADMSYEDGKLVDCLKAKFRDDPKTLARIDALVREGADGRTMKAMDCARDALAEMLGN